MRGVLCACGETKFCRFVHLSALTAALGLLLWATPVYAIPSPELVVGSFTSIAQLIALTSALIGGGATVITMRARGAGRERGYASRSMVGAAVAVIILLMTSVGLNVYQYVTEKNERQARLEDTLLRPSRTPGGLPIDPEVKELNYGQQTRHPLGMSTDEAGSLLTAAARGERSDLIFLDVRETAEREMGTLPGVTFVRYPDIPSANIDFTGKKAILFCHNGNRSHEVCEALKKLGIDCQFIVGGLEKWVVENRSIDGLSMRSLEELRAIPPYPNQKTLLDTPDVRRLIKDEKAIFVDVRYPGEFAQQRLPDAINLAIRRIPTPELQKQIYALPWRPIILPCYDRRGCFFAEVLGLELTRAGHDVRGRYTLPWNYFVQPGRPPHVQQWIEQNNQSIWNKTGRQLAGLLVSISEWTGTVLAIVLLAIVSRLLVLPFSLKAERDQIRSRAASEEFKALKSSLKDDPVRRARAIRGFYKRLGLTPIRNLVALLFLPIMAIALIAVQDLVATNGGGFLWVDNLAQPDPWLILPVLFAALITLYIDVTFVEKAKRRLWVWGIAFPLLTATGMVFSAGADIYLVASAVLLLVQRAAVSGHFKRLRSFFHRWRLGNHIVSLDEPTRLVNYGNKSRRLAQMRAEGMPVPNGLLLTPRFLDEFESASPTQRQRHVDKISRWLGSRPVAVRSSASAEDSEQHSFAGVFESVLNVDRGGLEAAISKVNASFRAERTKSYAAPGGSGSILVQRMVAADYAGVLFTRDPAAGGLAMVELVRGTAEDLVSGAVRPHTYRFGRVSGEPIMTAKPPIDLKPLLALGRQAERLFGGPQDIEWTYCDGRFFLVQSRDITRVMADESDAAILQSELERMLKIARDSAPDEIAFARNELSEMLPRPTPLSLSLMESLWAAGGSVDLAARALGMSYEAAEDTNYLVTILGRLYVNKRDDRARAIKIGAAATQKLIRNADQIERDLREDFLDRFQGDVRIAEAANFDTLSTPDLIDTIGRLRAKFIRETRVEVDIVNIAASLFLELARRELAKRGLDPSSYLGHIPETYQAHAIADAARAPVERRLSLALEGMGHRAVLDYELAEPRYSENPSALVQLIELHLSAAPRQQEGQAVAESQLGTATARIVTIARRFQALKEDAKHHSLREVAVLRRAVLALDRRLELGGLSFFLHFDELLSLRQQSVDALRKVAIERRKSIERMLAMPPLAPILTVSELEMTSASGEAVHHDAHGVIRGTRVSGTGIVAGKARVVGDADAERGASISGFENGDIIVASMIHPSWLPYFGRAGGFVCEVGGWLSHTAILAREHDVAMVVGTSSISAIGDGDRIRLHPDGRVEIVGEGKRLSAIAA
jgi:rifampicin phosphotransferase